jgi:hypothetical protein
MKNFTIKLGIWFSHHKILYYILNFTWGILANVMGSFVALALLISGHKPRKYFGTVQFLVGENWGGFSLGLFQVVCKDYTEDLAYHELGHSYQNIWMGPFWLFVVGIPSIIRYNYQNHREKKGLPNADYDSIWFEGSATEIGKDIYERNL